MGPREKGNFTSSAKLCWPLTSPSLGSSVREGGERMAKRVRACSWHVPGVMQRPAVMERQGQEGEHPGCRIHTWPQEPGSTGKAIQGCHALPSQFNERTAEADTPSRRLPGDHPFHCSFGAELHRAGHACSFLETSAQSTAPGASSELKKLLV